MPPSSSSSVPGKRAALSMLNGWMTDGSLNRGGMGRKVDGWKLEVMEGGMGETDRRAEEHMKEWADGRADGVDR